MRAGSVAQLLVVKYLPSALSTAGLAAMAALGVLLPRTALAQSSATPAFVQGAAFSTWSRVSAITVTLTSPVAQGDLLVGWISQFAAPEQAQVSDNVNGTGTRAPGSRCRSRCPIPEPARGRRTGKSTRPADPLGRRGW